MLLESVVFIIAGIITGIITGIVGASAVVAFIPLILLFFNYDAFTLIGMSLVLDVFVAIPALFNYFKYKNVSIKAATYMAFPAIMGAIVGTFVSAKISSANLTGITALFISFAGVIIFRRNLTQSKLGSFSRDLSSKDFKFWLSLVLVFAIGFFGGSVGAAGGVSVLFVFIFLFGFEVHEAVGTSVLMMFFIAIFGAATHFYYTDKMSFSWMLLLFAIMGGIIGSLFSSKIANKIQEGTLNKIVGSILFVLGITTFLHKVVF